jgi:hypothetical protein
MSAREASYAALFGALSAMQTGGTVALASRKLLLLKEVNNPQLPALFMQVDRQTSVQKPGTPAKRTLHALVYLYAANPDPNSPASTQLNGLIDATEAVLAPPPGQQVQTLGGVVAHAWIEGAIEVYEAPKGQRAAAVVPVAMLMP